MGAVAFGAVDGAGTAGLLPANAESVEVALVPQEAFHADLAAEIGKVNAVRAGGIRGRGRGGRFEADRLDRLGGAASRGVGRGDRLPWRGIPRVAARGLFYFDGRPKPFHGLLHTQ